MKKVIITQALDALKKQALKDQELKDVKGGIGISPITDFDPPIFDPPIIAGMFPHDPNPPIFEIEF